MSRDQRRCLRHALRVGVAVCAAFSMNLSAAPGDILFEEYFNNNGDLNSDWNRSDNGDVGVNNDTFDSPSRSAFMFSGPESLTLRTNRAIDAAVPSATLAVWIRRGSDSFSEDPDDGEDLTVEYLNSSNNWIVLETFTGAGTPGEIFDRVYTLPGDALHNALLLRFQNAPSNDGFDYWHIDDVIVTETGPVTVPDPVAEWRLDETLWTGAANEVEDESANNLHGRAINVGGLPGTDIVTPARSGDPGTCRYGVFDGPNSGYVQIDDPGTNSVLDISTALTVTTWVYPRSYPGSGLRTIVSKDENFEFHLNTSGQVNWWWGGGTNEMNSTGVVPLNTWTHIAIVYANGAQQIYLNGTLSGTNNDTGTLTTQNDPVLIGTDLGFNSRTFDGYIDEVRIYNGSLTSGQVNIIYNDTHPCSLGPDHYAITTTSPTVTCEPGSVTIEPHDAGDNAIAADGSTITLSTTPANDGWTLISGAGSLVGNQYTFAGGETSVQLGLIKTTPATLDIDVTDGSATDLDGNATEDPDITFVDAAFKFYSNGVVDSIGTQISRKASNVAPGNATLSIRAIQTDPLTGRCEALINGGDVDIGLAYECNNPTVCELGADLVAEDLTIDTTVLDGSDNGGALNYTPVTLNFDALGEATFVMNYTDAGRISLHASADLTVDGETVTVQGNSNDFVVRPSGFCVASSDSNAQCAAGNETCSVFRRAGETFNLTVSARAWGGSGESNTDFCDNAITPNFDALGIPLGNSLVAPIPGSLGSVGTATVSLTDANDGSVTISQSVSEVGVFQFSAGGVNDYLGATDADIALSLSANIGRFIPASFAIKNDVGDPSDDPTLTEANGTFTYLQQPFDVTYQIQAQNLGGGNTNNYTGAFATIGNNHLSHITYDALSGGALFDGARIQRPVADTIITWNNGVGGVVAKLVVERDTTLEAPLTDLTIGVRVDDDTQGGYNLETSNVNLDTDLSGTLIDTDDHYEIGVTVQRFGRLFAADVWGPESVGLSVPLQVQYWTGSAWQLSNGDETQIPRTDIAFVDSGGSSSPMTSDPITAPVGSNPGVTFTYDPSGNATLDFGDGAGGGSGDPGMFVGAPGAQGFFRVDVDLTSFPWLQFDWDQDGDFNDADETDLPRFTITFESYRGHDRVIYWREILSPQ